jgi:hypothetical protein
MKMKPLLVPWPHRFRTPCIWRFSMEENGSEFEENGLDDDDVDDEERDDESDAIIREKSDTWLPRDNI